MIPWYVRAIMVIAFTAIMLLWGFVWAGFVHSLPQHVVDLLCVAFLCTSVGFLLGQRHGIQR